MAVVPQRGSLSAQDHDEPAATARKGSELRQKLDHAAQECHTEVRPRWLPADSWTLRPSRQLAEDRYVPAPEIDSRSYRHWHLAGAGRLQDRHHGYLGHTLALHAYFVLGPTQPFRGHQSPSTERRHYRYWLALQRHPISIDHRDAHRPDRTEADQ